MADSRNMTFGLDFGLNSAISDLNRVVEQLESTVANLGAMESGAAGAGNALGNAGSTGAQAAQDMADGFNQAGQTAENAANSAGNALDDMASSADSAGRAADELGASGGRAGDDVQDGMNRAGEAAGNAGQSFLQAGAQADSFGAAFRSTMADAMEESGSFTSSFKAGIQGAFGYAAKQAGTLIKKGKDVGTAFLHPIKTIKGKLVDALRDAGKAAEDTGDSAEDAERDLKDAGEAGSDAGSAIKDAFKGAVASIVGIEAIKAGIDHLKNLVGAAIGAAGAVENVGAKFDAVFKDTDVQGWADNFSEAVHRSQSEVESFLVSNKALYQNMGITGEAADELSKITTSLAYDFGNAFKMEDGEALSVLQEAIGGSTEALAEYGFQLDDTALKEQARKMGIRESLDDLDDATLAQIRMNEILEQAGDIQQAAIKDTGGLVNSTKSLKGIFTDFMASAGAKFTPAVEKLFGAVMESWPVVEPMLMGFVGVLSSGMEQAVPVLMELGQTLIPVLTSVLSTLFQTATPLIDVFGGLAQTILPPFASILGIIGQTMLPPLVSILDTLNTAIIQPLMPILQHIVAALLPPMAQLLGAIGPMLQAVSPLLSIIGDALAWIADILGKVVGWLADGVGKVANFFGGLLGGAKESTDEVRELGGAMSDLDNITAAPSVEVAAPAVPDISVPVSAGSFPQVSIPEIEPFEMPEIGAADTKAFTASLDTANTEVLKGTGKTWGNIQENTEDTLGQIGAASEETCAEVVEQSESMWRRMADAAKTGAEKIVQAFKDIGSAALGVSGANISISGPDIPHNADGTDNFQGGWTHINEEGGEMAFLPQGSAIIPADETREIIGSAITPDSLVHAQSAPASAPPLGKMPDVRVTVDAPIDITVQGNADEATILRLMAEIKKWLEVVVDEKVRAILESIYRDLANQGCMT